MYALLIINYAAVCNLRSPDFDYTYKCVITMHKEALGETGIEARCARRATASSVCLSLSALFGPITYLDA